MDKVAETLAAILFDLDGTLINVTGAAEGAWLEYADQYGFDYRESLKSAHGMRVQDLVQIWCGVTEPSELAAETRRLEDRIVVIAKQLTLEGRGGIACLPGVRELLATMSESKARWAIVTSGTKHLSDQTIGAAGLPLPPCTITADDVTAGKPSPAPYLAAASALGVKIEDCLVVEDAPSGIRSGIASGAKVLAVCSSHPRLQLEGLGATWIVDSLERLRIKVGDGGDIEVSIQSAIV